jgi:hypothetical protein
MEEVRRFSAKLAGNIPWQTIAGTAVAYEPVFGDWKPIVWGKFTPDETRSAAARLKLSGRRESQHQENDADNKEDEEQQLRDRRGPGGDARETKRTGDDGNDGEDDRPFQHDEHPSCCCSTQVGASAGLPTAALSVARPPTALGCRFHQNVNASHGPHRLEAKRRRFITIRTPLPINASYQRDGR